MTHHTEAERADFELMREAYEKAFGPPPTGAALSGFGYAIKTHEASEARAYAERFKGFIAGWVARRAPAELVPQYKDRLLAALERAISAETALRQLIDEAGNDMTPGWEERLSACIDRGNEILAAAPQPPEKDKA